MLWTHYNAVVPSAALAASPFLEPGCLALELAQVIKLRSADLVAFDNFYLVNER